VTFECVGPAISPNASILQLSYPRQDASLSLFCPRVKCRRDGSSKSFRFEILNEFSFVHNNDGAQARAICEARAMMVETAAFPAIADVTGTARKLRDWMPELSG